MRQATTWWRNLSGLLAACVLALLVVAPTASLAACICEDDGALVGVQSSAAAVQIIQPDAPDHDAPCEAACCVGGHCHHGGVMLDPSVAQILTPAPLACEHAIAAAHALASRTISGPDRPPRG